MSNRREIWRDFMGRFEPSADPSDAVKRGFYVPRPGRSVAEQLAARFEIKPSASHLLVGGVGSGKTTQLLVAYDKLKVVGGVCAAYVDVSRYTDPATFYSTELLAIVGLELSKWLTSAQKDGVAKALRSFEWYLSRDEVDEGDVEHLAADIKTIIEAHSGRYTDYVLLVDAFDRISDLKRFAPIVEGAVMTLRSLGLGVILVGPLTALYGIERVVLDRFDRVWHLPSVDVQDDDDKEGFDFLRRVLQARDTNNLISAAAIESLIKFSGGVLRDLMTLTQVSGEEAYVDGADQVELRHVDIAADSFGRKHLVAVDSEQLAVLQGVRVKGTFVQTSEKHLALLATRRVLEYTNGQPRFTVHPTIEPLLAQIAGQA